MAVQRKIRIKGAREHNLRNVDVDVPREKFVVITGVSGSGKSSLAFDTIYAEGQRRYVESLSAYARQFLEQMPKPDVESVTGLPPTIAIEQRKAGANPRSTVATTTEIHDYLRLLFARAGVPHCPACERPITRSSPQAVAESILSAPEGTNVRILAPLVSGRKGEHKEVFSGLAAQGFARARVDGAEVRVWPPPALDKNRAHVIEAVVDRLQVSRRLSTRVRDSVETALRLGQGSVVVSRQEGASFAEELLSENFACARDGFSMPELSPRMFSFNSPFGACPTCLGLGTKVDLDEDLIVPDPGRSLHDGAVEPWYRGGPVVGINYGKVVRSLGKAFGIDIFSPFSELPAEARRIIMRGTTAADEKKHGHPFEGVIPGLMRRFERTQSEHLKRRIHGYMSESPCPACGGARLKPESRSVRVSGKRMHEVLSMSAGAALDFFSRLRLPAFEKRVAAPVTREIKARLEFLVEVGLDYLALDRRAGTLSGGEAQRIRLATQVGSALVGVCYVLDEPTIGLHARDTGRLLRSLKRLKDLGNTVITVEHDLETIRAADWVIDMGPGAGSRGGKVVAEGTVEQVGSSSSSPTGAFLSGAASIGRPKRRRKPAEGRFLTITGAKENNLKDLSVSFPLGVFNAVTGVSGSGKSTLVVEVMLKALRRRMHGSREKPGAHSSISGFEGIAKVVEIDQSPIGRTPRSNPATYTGVFGEIRTLFSMVKESKIRGYKPGRFSFNVPGGRCPACEGHGTRRIEMHFLPDVFVPCPECNGTRFGRETLEIRYKGMNIAQVLDSTVEDALAIFDSYPNIKRILHTLDSVGLGYVKLGQPATTLSGGEEQRVKLASELGRPGAGDALYVLDEPTTGLHPADTDKLLSVLHRLVDQGNTVVVIEHNVDVIRNADWVIDLGPEGGDMGGRVVAAGAPEAVAKVRLSHTGAALRACFSRRGVTRSREFGADAAGSGESLRMVRARN